VTQTKAMRLRPGDRLLRRESLTLPALQDQQVLLEVLACGVCRTDLHVLDGELRGALEPLTPGHEIVGRVVRLGAAVDNVRLGERVGVPWLGSSCGACGYCVSGRENLCDRARFTGFTLDGGYAEFALADARYCLRLPDLYTDVEAAPLLCAGLIGYRAYRAAGEGMNLGLYGFGAAAHLLIQVATAQRRRVFAFTRPGDKRGQQFARDLGAIWAGDSTQAPPETLDAAILFAPVGALVPTALQALRKGGNVVCAGIHMSDIPSFPYQLLWGERSVSSVANLTRADGADFMALAARVRLRPATHTFPLSHANEALGQVRAGKLLGAAVLVPDGPASAGAAPGQVSGR
jgi:alcohol dehydrogenase, propanol-preferring